MKNPPITSQIGFTLIEILVVLVIIGVMLASVVIKTFPDEHQLLRQEADRLALLLEQARDESFSTGRSLAWSMQNQTPNQIYGFWRLNAERQWMPIIDNPALRNRSLPANIALSALTVNTIKAPLDQRLIFSPSGLNIPFAATLELHSHRVHLLGDSAGRIQIKDEK